jgi:hypothetical protein
MSSAIHAVGVFLAVVILVVVYFLPFLIAYWRRHPYRWLVLLINLLGASGIGWIAALVIALWMPRRDRQVRNAELPHPSLPADWRTNQQRLGLEDPGYPLPSSHPPGSGRPG